MISLFLLLCSAANFALWVDGGFVISLVLSFIYMFTAGVMAREGATE